MGVIVMQPMFRCEKEVHSVKEKFECATRDLYFTSAPFTRKTEETVTLFRGSSGQLMLSE
jgi:hypothetical protein